MVINYPPNVYHMSQDEQNEVIPHSGGLTRREAACEYADADRMHHGIYGEHLCQSEYMNGVSICRGR